MLMCKLRFSKSQPEMPRPQSDVFRSAAMVPPPTEPSLLALVLRTKSGSVQKQPSQWKPRMEFKHCLYCGQKHAMRKLDCPAWGKQCKNCGGKNHFQTKCKNSKVRVHAVEDQEDSWLYHVGTARSSPKTRMTAKMGVDGTNINFQLDSGADVNTICRRFVKREQLLPSRINALLCGMGPRSSQLEKLNWLWQTWEQINNRKLHLLWCRIIWYVSWA